MWSQTRLTFQPSRWSWPPRSLQTLSTSWMSSERTRRKTRTRVSPWSFLQGLVLPRGSRVRRRTQKIRRSSRGAWATPDPAQTKVRMTRSCPKKAGPKSSGCTAPKRMLVVQQETSQNCCRSLKQKDDIKEAWVEKEPWLCGKAEVRQPLLDLLSEKMRDVVVESRRSSGKTYALPKVWTVQVPDVIFWLLLRLYLMFAGTRSCPNENQQNQLLVFHFLSATLQMLDV